MTALILWLMTGAGKVVAAIIAGGALLLGVYAKGRSSAQQKEAAKDAAENIATRERMDDAPIFGDDPHAARRWVSERKANQR